MLVSERRRKQKQKPLSGLLFLLPPSADKENRTPIFSLATRRFTTKLYPLESLKHGDYTGVFEGGNYRLSQDANPRKPTVFRFLPPRENSMFSRPLSGSSPADRKTRFAHLCSRQDSNLEYDVRSVA